MIIHAIQLHIVVAISAEFSLWELLSMSFVLVTISLEVQWGIDGRQNI